jgi:glucose 1-dehydrogenase
MVAFAADIKDSKLDMIIANAGLTEFGDFFEFSPESFQKVVDLNLRGTFFLAQTAAKLMKKQGGGGNIVLIGSNVGARAYDNLAAYGMSKAGISMLAKQLVLPLGPLGISINCVSPGATLTERTKLEEPDYAGIWAKLNPNGRVGKPEDIAHTVSFMLSPQSRHITGQTLLVDGGWTAYGPTPFTAARMQNDQPNGADMPNVSVQDS